MSSPVRTLDRTAQASAEILSLERTGRERSRQAKGRGVQSLFKQQSGYDSQREAVRSVVDRIGLSRETWHSLSARVACASSSGNSVFAMDLRGTDGHAYFANCFAAPVGSTGPLLLADSLGPTGPVGSSGPVGLGPAGNVGPAFPWRFAPPSVKSGKRRS